MTIIQRFKPSCIRRDARGELIEILNRGRWESILIARMKKGAIIGNHYHQKTDVFVYLASGRARVTTVSLSLGEKTLLKLLKRDGILIPARVAHTIEFLDDSTIIIGKSHAHDPDHSDVIDYSVLSPRDVDHGEDAYLHTRRFTWLRRRRLKKFTIRSDDRVLDLGCGDGINTEILFNRGVLNIVGIDVSQRLIQLAHQRTPTVPFVLGSAEKLPFRDQSFDVVFVDSVFHHLDQYRPAIREIQRVLTPGGRLYFIEPHGSWLRRLYDAVTVSPLTFVISSLRYRKQALIEEQEYMDQWVASERAFLDELTDMGYRKLRVTIDLLSVVGEYEKTGGRNP